MFGGGPKRRAVGSPARFAASRFRSPPDRVERFPAEYPPPRDPNGADSIAEPLFVEAAGRSPLLAAAAGLDPPLDESRARAVRLGEAGVRHDLVFRPKLAPGTSCATRAPDAALVALERLGQKLRRLLEEDAL